jgi:hypothetical protein
MNILKKIARFIAEYFVFFAGFLFIFVVGFLFAFLRPEGFLVNAVFLAIIVGWIIYLIKYFWDIMGKK